MGNKFKRVALAFAGSLMLGVSAAGHANPVHETPNALAMTGDALIARPALLATTLVGTGVFIVSLPFSAIGGNAGEAAQELVVEPAKATFMRCLGCTVSGRKVSDVVSQEEQNKQMSPEATEQADAQALDEEIFGD